MMNRIIAIAINTFRETIRDKILYNLLVFAVFIIGFSYFLGNLTVLEKEKVINDLGLAAIQIVGALMAIFIGIGLVSKEIEKRTIYAIVTKPVSRSEFLVGKYLGLLITIFLNVSVMFICLMIVRFLMGAGFSSGIFIATGCIFLELAVLVAVALFFSTFTTATLSAVFSLSVMVIGHFSKSLKFFGSRSQSVVVQKISSAIYYLFPNLENFNYKVEAAYHLPISLSAVGWAVVYAIIYRGVLLAFSALIFQRRDFK